MTHTPEFSKGKKEGKNTTIIYIYQIRNRKKKIHHFLFMKIIIFFGWQPKFQHSPDVPLISITWTENHDWFLRPGSI
jgi:hypothetical protein